MVVTARRSGQRMALCWASREALAFKACMLVTKGEIKKCRVYAIKKCGLECGKAVEYLHSTGKILDSILST